MILVWKKRVTDLLSVRIITDFGVPQKMCPNALKAKNIVKNSFAYMDIFNWAGLKVLDPYATGAKAPASNYISPLDHPR